MSIVRGVNRPTVAIFHCGFIYSGGGERIVLEEAKELKKRGWKVLVYAPTMDKNKCYPELLKELKVKTFFPSLIDKLPLRNALRMITASLFAPLLAFGFRKVDIFIGANQPGAWIAFCMAKVLGKPYVVYLNQPNRIVYPRSVDREYGWSNTEKDYHFLYKVLSLANLLLIKLDWLSVVKAKVLLVNGKYIGSVIQNVYGKEVVDDPAGSYYQNKEVIKKLSLNVFNGQLFINGNTITKPYILITNRHDPQKRFDYVISALEKVLKTNPNVTLVIPGPFTEHTQNLIAHAKNRGICDRVVFTNQVKESDLQRLYGNSAVYCYPSPQEDFGLGPLEAGGWGVPTVAWNWAGPTVTVDDGISGMLAKPYDVTDFASKISVLINSPKLRNKMGMASWERTKEKFSWKKHVDILETAIDHILKS